MIFLFIGAFFIISNENLKMNSKENILYFFKEYSTWINKLFNNTKVVVGYVIKMYWLP